MAWELDDVARSVRRYLAMTLPTFPGDEPRWKIRVERREVRDEDRPVGVVVLGQIATTRARTSRLQGQVEEVVPVTINLYPPIPEDATGVDGVREARLEAHQLATQLHQLFNTGLTVKVGERHFAGPFNVPLWDYADVPVSGKEKSGPADPHDVLWVDDKSLNVQAIQDPDDYRRWSVIANLRVSIERPGRGPAADEIVDVTGLEGHFDGEPPVPVP